MGYSLLTASTTSVSVSECIRLQSRKIILTCFSWSPEHFQTTPSVRNRHYTNHINPARIRLIYASPAITFVSASTCVQRLECAVETSLANLDSHKTGLTLSRLQNEKQSARPKYHQPTWSSRLLNWNLCVCYRVRTDNTLKSENICKEEHTEAFTGVDISESDSEVVLVQNVFRNTLPNTSNTFWQEILMLELKT